MKNSILIVLAAAMLLSVSCVEKGRSSATFSLGTDFELADYYLEDVLRDSIMFAPENSWESIMFFKSQSTTMNEGYLGGLVLSTKKGSADDPESLTMFSSADPGAGALNSNCYMGYYRTATMPDYDIVLDLSGYSTASSSIIGFYVCNSLYTSMLAWDNRINPGDFLKLKVEFFNKDTGAFVGSIDKYLVDYTNPSVGLKMVNEWEPWDIAKELQNTSASVGSFTGVRFSLESNGSEFKPCFCLDSFFVQLSVEY